MRARLATVPLPVLLIAATALAMLIPATMAFGDRQAAVGRAFVYSALVFLILSALLALALANRVRRPGPGSLFPLLATAYVALPAVMAVPLAEALPQLRFVDAWFEMVSAFTTTGATVIDLPRRVPAALHLWRGMVGWMGGLFILAAATAILAPMRLGGLELSAHKAGGRGGIAPGAAGADQRLRSHALALLPAYGGLTLALWIVLTLVGVPGFDALMQAMAVLSTSGILPRESLGGVGLGAEIAIFAFLLLAVSRRFLPGQGTPRRALRREPEVATAAIIVALVTAFVVARHALGAFEIASGQTLPGLGRAAWGAAFTSLSFLTTTGFVSQDWIASRVWSGLTPPGLVLMGLALLGGGVATTAGGIKLLRVFALTRLAKFEFERMIYPSMVVGGTEYDRFLGTVGARAAWLFAMVFAFVAIAVVALLLILGLSLETALIFAVAALANAGPLVQVAGDLPLYWVLLGDPARLVLALAMILGRLEILVLLALILGRTRRA